MPIHILGRRPAASNRQNTRPVQRADHLVARVRSARAHLLEAIACGTRLRIARAPITLSEAAEVTELLDDVAAALLRRAS